MHTNLSTEELLNEMEQMQESSATDTKAHCIIDPETRTINVAPEYKILGVESDEKVERVWFQCPKIVGDNIDLSKLQLRINYQNARSEKDQYIVTDVQIEEDDIVFSWLVSRKATAYTGAVNFIVCAVSVDEGVIKNEWNTTLASSEVLTGLEVDSPQIDDSTEDVITQLLQIAQESSTTASEAAETASQAAQEAKEAANKAVAVGEFDPSDYATAAQGAKADTSVQKVNGQTPDEDGNVNITVSGGGGEGTVKSVNSKGPDTDGNVVLTASDIGALTSADLSDYAQKSEIPKQASDIGAATSQQGSKADTAVQSINSKSGVSITLAPSDIGAATAAQGAKADTSVQKVNGQAPDGDGNVTISVSGGGGTVTSVNSKGPDGSGNVTITASDVGAATVEQGEKADSALQPNALESYAKKSEIPDTLPNPQPISIQLGQGASESYDGSSVKTVRITPQAIGAATADQGEKADTALQPGALSGYAQTGDIPSTLPNPNKLTIQLNSSPVEYDGSAAKSITITPDSIGAQIKGDYLTSEDLTGYAKASDLANFVTDEDLSQYATTSDLSSYVTQSTFNSEIDGKLNKYQGASYSGKYLGVNSSGYVVPMSIASESSGQVTLIKTTTLTSWAQNNTISVSGITNYDLIGISCVCNTNNSPEEIAPIQWFKLDGSSTTTYALHSVSYDHDVMVLETQARLITVNKSSGVITSKTKGFFYSWAGSGNDEVHCVPRYIYGIKF